MAGVSLAEMAGSVGAESLALSGKNLTVKQSAVIVPSAIACLFRDPSGAPP